MMAHTLMTRSSTTMLAAIPNPLSGMHAIERGFRLMRRMPPDLTEAFRYAFTHLMAACPNNPLDYHQSTADLRIPLLLQAGLAVAAAVDADAARRVAARHTELAYHNRYHFCEATLAMGWLCAIAYTRGTISLHQAVLGIVAMVGHDYGHDGTWDQTGALEELAANAVAAIAASVGVGSDDRSALRGIVLATALPAVRANKARAAELERAGHCQSGAAAMHLMASEADVLTSLMPSLGCRLGHALAAEWAINPGTPPLDPASFTGRVAFLGLHDYLSDASIELGLRHMHVSQVMAFRQLAASWDQPPLPEAAAAILDQLPPRQATRLFAAAMLQTSRSGPPPISTGPGLFGEI